MEDKVLVVNKKNICVCLIRKCLSALTWSTAEERPSWMFAMITARLTLIQIYTLNPSKTAPKVHCTHFFVTNVNGFLLQVTWQFALCLHRIMCGSWDSYLKFILEANGSLTTTATLKTNVQQWRIFRTSILVSLKTGQTSSLPPAQSLPAAFLPSSGSP